MFGMVDAYAPGVAPPKGSGFTGDNMAVKLIVDTYQDGTTVPVMSISGTFIAPIAGRYLFVLQGAGGFRSNNQKGGAGALAARTVRLFKGALVPYTVAYGGLATSAPLVSASTVTFADRVMSAGTGGLGIDEDSEAEPPVVGRDGAPGVATGGDVNLSAALGALQAPSYGPFLGGKAAQTANFPNGHPGSPGTSFSLSGRGGNGRLTVVYIGP